MRIVTNLKFIFFPELNHFSEDFELPDRRRDPSEGIEQGHDLVPRQFRQTENFERVLD